MRDVQLTEAEWTVLQLRVRDGLSVAAIARQRHGVARTVQNHFNRIYQKLGVGGDVDATDKHQVLADYYWACVGGRSAARELRLVAAGGQGRSSSQAAPTPRRGRRTSAPAGDLLASQQPPAADPLEGLQLRALSARAAPNERRPRAGILPPLPTLVLGRSEALREIKDRLIQDGSAPGWLPVQHLTVVRGWPGVGKSTLAACLAHDDDLAAQFPDGVLWAALGPQPSVLGTLAAWGRALALEGLTQLTEVGELSQQLARHLTDKRVLLIVDDVWDEGDARPFMVGGRGCALLLTTRLTGVAEALAPTAAALYTLPVLDVNAALALLEALAPAVISAHSVACRALVEELEGLPLAVQVAGHLLQTEARLGWGVSELLAELREGVVLLRQEAPPDLVDLASQTIPTVAVLLQRSTERLDAVTRERFALLGAFPPKPATFDPEALAAVWAVADPRPTVRALVERGLLEPVGAGRFQMHALLVLHARALLEE